MTNRGIFYIADDLPTWPLPDWISRLFDNLDDVYRWLRIWT